MTRWMLAWPAPVGHIDEWHLHLVNVFRHPAFDLGPWSGQPAVVIASPILHPRLVSVGAVHYPVRGDGVEEVGFFSG